MFQVLRAGLPHTAAEPEVVKGRRDKLRMLRAKVETEYTAERSSAPFRCRLKTTVPWRNYLWTCARVDLSADYLTLAKQPSSNTVETTWFWGVVRGFSTCFFGIQQD
jgi:hypothetical protein